MEDFIGKIAAIRAAQAMSHAQALAVTSNLMVQWQRKHPEESWVMAANDSSPTGHSKADAGGAHLAGPGAAAATNLQSQQGDTYASFHQYQEQLQRIALLRDMIDWCIENQVKNATLDPNDPKMRALEAYIIAQRKGAPLDYGKH